MRRFLRTTAAVASSAGLLTSHLPSPRCETADDAYLRALRGEAAAVQDFHFHPVESRTMRVTLTANF